MQIALNCRNLSELTTDLLVLILDDKLTLYESDSPAISDLAAKIKQKIADKQIKREFFCNLPDSSIKNVLICSTSFNHSYDLGENVKIFTAKAIRFCRDYNLSSLAVAVNSRQGADFVGKVAEGAILGSYTFDKYKKEKNDFYSKLKLEILAHAELSRRHEEQLRRYTLVSEAINECRTLINEPGSVVYPEVLANVASEMARSYNLECSVLDEKQLAEQGYNGLIHVGKGSVHPPRLIKIKYAAPSARYTVALVGKGITFDSGGISLKPADRMYEMKGDMAGGAAVIYAMKALAQLRPQVNVIGIVPTAENLPDANAQRPGDIFYAKNGKSIMVDNTDAEGRLILTDGFYVAGEEKATHIIDIATLTGACVRALGTSVAGIMGNDRRLVRAVIEAGAKHGEVYWELPLVEEYKEMLKTPYADINNIGGPYAGAITAALFLQEFVPENTPWAHLDIAGPFMKDKEWKYYEAGAIGFGVKTLVELCEHFEEYIGS